MSPVENPVARHAARLITRRHWPAGVVALLAFAALLGALLQQYWMELDLYSFLHPRLSVRWLALVLLADTAIALPWAAVRGALLWRRLERDGALDEYRRTRLSPVAIAAGALWGALFPIVVLLALSLIIGLVAGPALAQLPVGGVLWAHGLLLAQVAAFGAVGLWLSERLRHPGLAIPAALALLAAAVAAIFGLEPFYRKLGDPSPWIYAALLPNPVTAVGNALETDVLRFGWIYERVHAHEYFFMYPPAWQTLSLYVALAVLALAGVRNACRRR